MQRLKYAAAKVLLWPGMFCLTLGLLLLFGAVYGLLFGEADPGAAQAGVVLTGVGAVLCAPAYPLLRRGLI